MEIKDLLGSDVAQMVEAVPEIDPPTIGNGLYRILIAFAMNDALKLLQTYSLAKDKDMNHLVPAHIRREAIRRLTEQGMIEMRREGFVLVLKARQP